MPSSEAPAISLLTVPFPYRSMLAICSDLDETPGLDCYIETSRFLNSTGSTRFGDGIGLETGNTIYFHMPDGELSYFNTTDRGRELIHALIRSGHIDCLHSCGDTADHRSMVKECLSELEAHGCRLKVWIDHSRAPSNIGADIMHGRGDLPGAAVYHTDLSVRHGIRYVSRGRVTSVIGQDVRSSLGGILDRRAAAASVKTIAKEFLKHAAARMGSAKYAMHGDNALLRRVELRDGQTVLEFLRSNPHPRGVSYGENAQGLGEVLSDRFFDTLVRRAGKCILYTHLGKKIDPSTGFSPGTIHALRALKAREDRNEILVTTTKRVLEFAELLAGISWRPTMDETGCRIEIDNPRADLSLEGLGFSVEADLPVRLVVNGRDQNVEAVREPGGSGYSVWSIPWGRLEYPL